MSSAIAIMVIGSFLLGFYWRFKKKKMMMDGEILECI
jgi:hypothetical protein